jgi:predicted esterase
VRAALALAILLAVPQESRNLLENGSFEDTEGDAARSWSAVVPPQHRAAVEFTVESKDAKDAKRCVRIKNTEPANGGVNSFTHRLSADAVADLRGKWVELSGFVKGREAVVADVWVQCFDDVERELAKLHGKRYGGLFGTFEWTRLAARGEVPRKTKSVVVRCVLQGTGEAWFDGMKLAEIKPDRGEEAPKPTDAEAKFREGAAKFASGGEKPAPPESFAVAERALSRGLGPAPWATGYKRFSFTARDREWSYEVWIPEEAKKGVRLPMLLDPGHPKGADDHKNWVAGGARDLFVLRSGILDALEKLDDFKALEGIEKDFFTIDVFAGLLKDARRRLPVDPDRVYLTGLSMTAHADWMLAVALPGEFAAAAPFSGFPRNFLQMAANLRGQGWYVVHGDADTICPVAATRAMVGELKSAGVDHVYRELRALGHVEVIIDRGNALEWMAGRVRDPYPKKVAVKLLRSGGAYWLEGAVKAQPVAFDPEKGFTPTASIDGEIKDNVVTIQSKGVERIQVWLNERMVDFSKPVRFVVNGKESEQRLQPSFDTLLERLKATADGGALYQAVVELAP